MLGGVAKVPSFPTGADRAAEGFSVLPHGLLRDAAFIVARCRADPGGGAARIFWEVVGH